MTVRSFATPTSLNESIANAQPPMADAGGYKGEQPYTPSQKEPLANHGPKNQPGITFAAQDKLPKLPIPDLDSTLKKYKEVLKPLQSKRAQEDTASAVQSFLRAEGPELQSRLKKYATGKTSYIEQFCTSSPHRRRQRTSLSILMYLSRVRLIPEFRQSCSSQFESLLPA